MNSLSRVWWKLGDFYPLSGMVGDFSFLSVIVAGAYSLSSFVERDTTIRKDLLLGGITPDHTSH